MNEYARFHRAKLNIFKKVLTFPKNYTIIIKHEKNRRNENVNIFSKTRRG